MNHVRKFIFPLIILLLISISIGISIIPDLYRTTIAPPHTFFPFVHNNKEDFFYYLSLIHQGYEGHLKVASRMSPEVFPTVYIQTLFTILGLFAKIIHLQVFQIYFLSRVLFGGALLFVCFRAIRLVFREKKIRIISLCLICFSTGFWSFQNIRGSNQVVQYLLYWSRFDPALRATYLPHHTLSTLLGLLSMVFFVKAIQSSNKKYILTSGICGFISGLIYFATVINILGGMIIGTFVFIFIKKWKQKNSLLSQENKKLYINFFIYTASIFLSLFYIFLISKNVFPWSNYPTVQKAYTFNILFNEYVLALGPTGVLTLIGIPVMIMTSQFFPLLLFGWVLFPFIGIYVLSPLFHSYANVYFLEATSYIPLGILSIYGLKTLQKLTRLSLLPIILTICIVLYSVPAFQSSILNEEKRLLPNRYNVFIPEDAYNGMIWLDQNTPSESVVLAGGYFGVLVPAFSHNKVVNGHAQKTYNPTEKMADLLLFFKGTDSFESEKILKKYNVSYIFYSLDTDKPSQQFINDLHIEKVYTSPSTIIYKVL